VRNARVAHRATATAIERR